VAITLTHVGTGDSASITLVLGYKAARRVDTVVHEIVGVAARDFTLKPAGPRTGTFRLFATDETAAADLVTLLCRPGTFSLADTETAMADTTFTPTGAVDFELDSQTLRRVVVSVDYTEVLA
jgi:hypothetical protein